MERMVLKSLMAVAIIAVLAGQAGAEGKDEAKPQKKNAESVSRLPGLPGAGVVTFPVSERLRYDLSARLYVAACAACHYNGALRPDSGVRGPAGARNPDELLRAILFGKEEDDGEPGMPAYGAILSDAEIAALAGYLRGARSANAPWPALAERVAKVRRAGSTE
ncbi:MAG: c-type cytochrome [Beijerinckiaceae bacterium]